MSASAGRALGAWTALRAAVVSVVLVGAACQYEMPTQPDLGFVKVDVVTTGEDKDLDGYAITLDGGQTTTIGVSSNSGSFFVPAGTHVVSIANVAPNCSVDGATTRQAEVTRQQSVTVQFTIACVGTGVRITTATSGPDNPLNFKVTVDERPSIAIAVNGTHTVGRLTAGTHSVTLTVPEHCTVGGTNPLSIVAVDKGYVAAGFTVVCSPLIRREKIAYVSAPEFSVETITPDGSRVDRPDMRGNSIAWKRDGTQLAISDVDCGYYWYYYGIDDCSGGVYLADLELGTISRLAGSDDAFRPAWSPVRDQIVFDRAGQRLGTGGRVSQLFVLDAGAPAAQVIFVAGERLMVSPTWAPDGERIAYVCAPQTGNADLCVVNRDGTGHRRLTSDATAELDPAWSPDGKTIAYTRISAGGTTSGDIALIDVGTGDISVLGSGSDPAWSPDGSRMVFVTVDGLFLMDADGSNRRRLTTGKHIAPAWRPIK